MAFWHLQVEVLQDRRAQKEEIAPCQHITDAAVLADAERQILVGQRKFAVVVEEVFRLEASWMLDESAVVEDSLEHRDDYCVARYVVAAQLGVAQSSVSDAKSQAHEKAHSFGGDRLAVGHAVRGTRINFGVSGGGLC